MNRTRILKLPTSYELALSEQGDRIAALGRNVVVAGTVSRKRIFSCHPFSHPSHACFNSEGTILAVKNTSGHIVLIDSATGETIIDFCNKRDGEGSNLHFSKDDAYLVDGSWGGQVFVRHVSSGKIELQLEFKGEMIKEVSRSSDRRRWAFLHQPKYQGGSEMDSAYVTLWEWPFMRSETVLLNLDIVQSAVLSPNGDILAVSGWTGSTYVINLLERTGCVLQSISTDNSCSELRWSSCGTLLGYVSSEEISIHSSKDLEKVKSFPMQYASSVCFAPDLSFIALGSWEMGVVQPLEL